MGVNIVRGPSNAHLPENNQGHEKDRRHGSGVRHGSVHNRIPTVPSNDGEYLSREEQTHGANDARASLSPYSSIPALGDSYNLPLPGPTPPPQHENPVFRKIYDSQAFLLAKSFNRVLPVQTTRKRCQIGSSARTGARHSLVCSGRERIRRAAYRAP